MRIAQPALWLSFSVALAAFACSDSELVDEGPTGNSSSGRTGSSSSGSSGTSSSSSGSSGTSSSSSGSSGTSSSSSGSSGTSSSSSGGADSLAEARARCLNAINGYRATVPVAALQAWDDDGIAACADEMARSDEANNAPHAAWRAGGVCQGFGQNECLGYGSDNIEACLQSMWNEKDLPQCQGCLACSAQQISNGSCANCEFSSCGHWLNMRSDRFSRVVCGFNPAGSWSVQNFR